MEAGPFYRVLTCSIVIVSLFYYAVKADHLNATQEPDNVLTIFTSFNCSTYISCTKCVSSQLPCNWCMESHRCTHDTHENCGNDIVITGVSQNGSGNRSGPGFCPTINVTGDDGPEILVPDNSNKSIQVKVHNIGQFIAQMPFVCQFNVEDRMTSVKAQLLGDTIYCDVVKFSYEAQTASLTATFAVTWSGSKSLDNPNNIHVVIYRCREMADSCGECTTLDDKYKCGWCSSSKTCELEDQCGISDEGWLINRQGCPNVEHIWLKDNSGVFTVLFNPNSFGGCDAHLSCKQCTNSQGHCVWCLTDHRCMNDWTEKCPEDVIVTSINRWQLTYYTGPYACPKIYVKSDESEILVPAKSNKSVNVHVSNMRHVMYHSQYMCQFNIEGRVTNVTAKLESEFPYTVHCDAMNFTYEAKTPQLTATITVMWNGSIPLIPLDNHRNLHVVIYNCKEMADSCAGCNALDAKYKCGWCLSTNTCEVKDQCNTLDQADGLKEPNWLNNKQMCPNPELRSPSN